MVPTKRSVCAAAASLLFTVDAFAADLSWTAPKECPEQPSVVGDLEELIGQPIAQASAIHFAVLVEQRPDGGWHAELTTTGRNSGSRSLTGGSCAEVSRAAVVAMALVVNSDREQSTAESSSVNKKASEPAPRKPVSQPEAEDPAQEEPSSIPLHPLLHASAMLDGTALPSYALGVALDAGIALDDWRILVGGLYLPPVEERQGDSGGKFALLAASVTGCYRLPLQTWAALLCGRYELGRLRGEGIDVAQSRPQNTRWNAVAAEAVASLPFSSTAELGLGVAAVVPLERAKFVLDSPEPVHELPAIGPRLQAGVTVVF